MPAQAGIFRHRAYVRQRANGGWTYIVTDEPRGTPYTGVTSNLAADVVQHRAGTGSAFCRRYGLHRPALAERRETIEAAIAREKAVKAGRRACEIKAIEEINADWIALLDLIA